MTKIQRRTFPGLSRLCPSLPMPFRVPGVGLWLYAGDVVSRRLLFGEPMEVGERRFAQAWLKPGMVVFDIGAHHGLYSMLAGRRVGPAGRVVSFEPSPREYRRLTRHLKLNRLHNVTVEPLAIGAVSDRGVLYVCDGRESGCNSLRVPSVDERVVPHEVQVTSVDSYVVQHSVDRLDFMKIDIEGGELSALEGAVHVLTSVRPAVLVEVADVRTREWGYRAIAIRDALSSHNYLCHEIHEDGTLSPWEPRSDVLNMNLVALPQ